MHVGLASLRSAGGAEGAVGAQGFKTSGRLVGTTAALMNGSQRAAPQTVRSIRQETGENNAHAGKGD